MMGYADTLRRHRNLIDSTEQKLKNNYINQKFNTLNYMGINYHGLIFHLNFYFTEIDIESYLLGDVVVVGIPLNTIKVQVEDVLEPRDSNVSKYFKTLEINKGGLTQQEASDMNYFITHCTDFPASTYAAEITNKYKTCEYSYSLATSEFPKFKNKKILPIMIFDFKKGTASFFSKENVKSYREGRSEISLHGFNVSSEFVSDNFKWNTIPSALIEAQLIFNCGKERKLRFQGIPYSNLVEDQ